ncbi:ABC transporter substrate-binding protein [bacterium]|nr:ABC transporter substrate-binding protein [bacterium]
MSQFFLGCKRSETPEVHPLDRAIKLYSAGALPDASREITRRLGQELDAATRRDALLLAARIELAMGDFEGAISRLDELGEPPPELEFDTHYLLAKSLVLAGELDRASERIASLETSSELPDSFSWRDLLSALYFYQSGDCTEATLKASSLALVSVGLLRSESLYIVGLCAMRTGNWDEAVSSFALALEELPTGHERYESLLSAGRASEMLNTPLAAIDFYIGAIREVSNVFMPQMDEAAIRDLVEALLLKEQSADVLRSVLERYGNSFPADVAVFSLCRLLVLAGDSDEATETIRGFAERFPESYLVKAVADLEESLNLGLVGNASRIGLIAPLTGDLAFFGEHVLWGVEAALRDHYAASGASISLIVKDSEGEPDKAFQSFVSLAMDSNVIAIVGPVSSKSLDAVSELADEYRMPVFSPSACGPGILGRSDFVFRNCVPLWTQAATIAEFAVRRLKLRRIAVLMPEKQYGLLLADSFITAATSAGAEIVFVKSYAAEGMDFGEVLSGLCLLEPDGVFIADNAAKVAVIAPQILCSNIHDAVLLGWDGWNSPETLASALGELEGAFFVTTKLPDDDSEEASSLRSAIMAEHGADVSPLLKQSYDATTQVCRALFEGAFYRQILRDRMLTTTHPGNLGEYDFTDSGQATRSMQILTIANGRIINVCRIVPMRPVPPPAEILTEKSEPLR